jgi:glycosyltransferase involved in cell wall biosynthesis
MTEPVASERTVKALGDLASEAGIAHVHMLAWRDLDDVEAGGSELHAHNVASIWAQAGLAVTMRTSFAPGKPQHRVRSGYTVIRKAGRYAVFPRSVASELSGRLGPRDALVEIWNGMPFFTPLWCTGPRSVWLHHVHGPMWDMMLPPRLAALGNAMESRVAPLIYRRSQIVTLSESSKHELVQELGLRPDRVRVVPPGIDASYSPGGAASPTPLLVAVGRLVPVKDFARLVDLVVRLRRHVPEVRLVIVGEGMEHDALSAQIHEHRADDFIELAGRVGDEELVELYRSAWALVSVSVREGWGMTATEAAACGTPAVATRIAGHTDAIVDGSSGLLAETDDELLDALRKVLTDNELRQRLSAGALERAAQLTWDATAIGTFTALAGDRVARRNRNR